MDAVRELIPILSEPEALWLLGTIAVAMILSALFTVNLASPPSRALGLLLLAVGVFALPTWVRPELPLAPFARLAQLLVGAALLLLLYRSWLTESRQTYGPVLLLALLLTGLFFVQPPAVDEDIALELALLFAGVYISVVSLKREWWVGPSVPAQPAASAPPEPAIPDVPEGSDLQLRLPADNREVLEAQLAALETYFEIVSEPQEYSGAVWVAARFRVVAQGTTREALHQQALSFAHSLTEQTQSLSAQWQRAAQRAKVRADDAPEESTEQAYYRGISRATLQAATELDEWAQQLPLMQVEEDPEHDLSGAD